MQWVSVVSQPVVLNGYKQSDRYFVYVISNLRFSNFQNKYAAPCSVAMTFIFLEAFLLLFYFPNL